MVLRVHEIPEGLTDQFGFRVSEDPFDGCALIANNPVAPDQGDDVGRVLHQRAEMLLAFGQLGRVGFQLAVEGQVVTERQELADDDQDDDGEQAPEHDGIQLAGLRLLDSRNQRSRDHRDVWEQQAEPVGPGVGGRAQRRGRGGPQCRNRDQQVAGHPAGVDHVAGAVLVGGREIGETAVGQQVGGQPGGEQEEGKPGGPRSPCGKDDHHGGDHHVTGRIGEADERGQQSAVAGPIHGAQDGGPADDQEGPGNEQPVQDGAGERHSPRWCRGEEQDGRDGKGDGHQVPEIRQRRERDLLAFDQFVVRPGHLPGSPGSGREAHQGPGGAGAASMANRGECAGSGGHEGDHELADIVDALGGGAAAPGEQQPGGEEQAKDGPSDEHDQETAVACHVRFGRAIESTSRL